MLKSLLLLFLFAILNVCHLKAQEKVVELSGRISDISNSGIKGVLVGIKSKKQYTQTDKRGMFDLVVNKGDTIICSHVTYANRYLVIPDSLANFIYSIEITMVPDTILIDPVIIFPWRTYKDFKEAFIAQNAKENKEVKNANRNINIINQQFFNYELHDSKRSYQYFRQQHFVNASNKGTIPSISVLNPFAWVKFFSAISDGTIANSKNIPDLPDNNK